MPIECEIAASVKNGLLIVVFTAIFCLSIVGNAAVIVTICQRRKTVRSIINFYLLNLAIADLLRTLCCMPSTLVSELVHCWMFGPVMCKLVAYMQPVTVCASAYTLAIIALERYYAICQPLQSRKCNTKRHALTMIAMVWLVSFASSLGSLLIYEEETYTKGWSCVSVMSASVDLAYQIYTTLVLLCIPLLIMTVLYGNVIFALKTGTVKLENPLNSLPSMEFDGECRRSSIGTWVLETIKAGDRGSKVQDQNGIDIGSVQLTVTQQEQKQQQQQQLQRPSLPGLVVQQQEVYSRRCTTTSLTASSLFGGGARHSSVDLDNCFLLRSNNQEKALLVKKQVTRMLITLVITFMLCWMPSYIWWMLVRIGDQYRTFHIWNDNVNTAITVLTYVSCCTNPVTYCFLNGNFRKALLSSWLCCRGRFRRNLKKNAKTVADPAPTLPPPSPRRSSSVHRFMLPRRLPSYDQLPLFPKTNNIDGASVIVQVVGPISEPSSPAPLPLPRIQIQFIANGHLPQYHSSLSSSS